MSTSISTATLSEVYTLSWDIPSVGASRDADGEENNVTQFSNLSVTSGYESVPGDHSEPQQSSRVSATNRNQNQQKTQPDPVPEAKLSSQEPHSAASHIGSDQLDNSESPSDPVVQDNETKRTDVQQIDPDQIKPATEYLEEPATNSIECEPSPNKEEDPSQLESIVPQHQQPKQKESPPDGTHDPAPNLIPAVPVPSPPAREPPADLQALSKDKESASEATDLNNTSILSSSSAIDEVQQVAPSAITPAVPLFSPQPCKSGPSAANPFKIQKVKSSDLKSFKPILHEEENKHAQVDQASSLGTGLHLSVPMESLEIISDSEEGDGAASAILPEWLKEGEFVTVGTNKTGIVRYVGPTDFAEGTWVGVELEVPAGRYSRPYPAVDLPEGRKDSFMEFGKNDN